MKAISCPWAAAFLLGGLAVATAGESAKETVSDDEMAIRRNVQAYVQAYERQDAKALAELWAPNAVYVNPDTGKRVTGRGAIEAEFQSQFKKTGPSKLRVHVLSIRLVTPGVAIEDGTATVTQEGESSDSTYTAVHVKHGDRWLLDSIRETVLPAPGPAHEQLKALEWLVGTWNDDDDNTTVHSKYSWAANGAFLKNEFNIYVEDHVALQGVQIIAWDAANKKIRSWAFDSDGGFAEGEWQADGDRWVIHSHSTLPDGKRGSAINVIRKIDNDHGAYSSSARHIDGELLPNVDEVEIVRDTNAAQQREEN